MDAPESSSYSACIHVVVVHMKLLSCILSPLMLCCLLILLSVLVSFLVVRV